MSLCVGGESIDMREIERGREILFLILLLLLITNQVLTRKGLLSPKLKSCYIMPSRWKACLASLIVHEYVSRRLYSGRLVQLLFLPQAPQ